MGRNIYSMTLRSTGRHFIFYKKISVICVSIFQISFTNNNLYIINTRILLIIYKDYTNTYYTQGPKNVLVGGGSN
jgi:hypothetical protein